MDIVHEYFIDYASDAIPNDLPSVCDGMLPVHRKVIYALYEAGSTHDKPFKKMLMNSAEVMKYYIYGDMPLTSAMKNAGSNFVSYKYLDPKGSYPDKNRRDGVGASPRYIECRLTDYSEYMLQGIKHKNVPFVPNWDNSREEPVYLPCPVPNMLINNSESIAVGFSSKIPSHNLNEICDAFISYMKDGNIDKAISYIKGCDSPLGAELIYDENEIRKIFTTGRGSYQMVCKWSYDKKENKIVIHEIPMSTVIEDIDDKIRLNIEKGKLKEIVDVHDNSGKDGLQYDVYLKRGADVETVISKLRKFTPFQSSVPIYLYMLKQDGITPHLYNLEEIIQDWVSHRIDCITKELISENKTIAIKANKMEGLLIIAKDIDTAHRIIKESKNEKEAIACLTNHFGLNKEQAEYISTIRMVNMNKDWISKQTKEHDALKKTYAKNEKILANDKLKKEIIVKQLEEAKEKYGCERKTSLLYDVSKDVKVDLTDDYNCQILCTEHGYVKKLMRYSDNQKIKDGDTIMLSQMTTNKSNLLVFTDKANMYTVKISTLIESVPSSLGQYLPSVLKLEADENIISVIPTKDYKGNVVYCFENGKVARVELSAYNKSTKKMTKAYSTASKLVGMFYENENEHIRLETNNKKRIIFSLKNIGVKSGRNTIGVQVIKVPKDGFVTNVGYSEENKEDLDKYFSERPTTGKKF